MSDIRKLVFFERGVETLTYFHMRWQRHFARWDIRFSSLTFRQNMLTRND